MRLISFSKRCASEVIRDPLNIVFALGFPIVLLLLLSAIQANVPVELFAIERLAPGVAVFGLSFITLFSATLIARDRESAFLVRLYTTPLRSSDFILGYTLTMVPISLAQTLVCYLVAIPLGLPLNVNILYAVLGSVPISLLYVFLGLLCGSTLNVKQVGGICGALLTNLSAWLSGVWFDLELVGDGFVSVARLLPFVHAVELQRALISGANPKDFLSMIPIFAYTAVIAMGAVLLFLRQMKRQ